MNSHRYLKNLWPVMILLLLLPAATAAWAQGGGNAAAASAPMKVAVINLQQAIVTTAEGKQASAQLQSQFAPEQNDLDNMQKQMADLQNKLTAGQRTLSADAQAQIQRQGELLQREFGRKQDNLNEEATNAQTDIVDAIGKKMLDVIERYARENSVSAVLNTSAQGTPVVYGAPQIDITTEIVRLYDQAWPVKTSSAPATPAGRPAAQPAAPSAAPASAAPAAAKKPTP